MEAQSSQPASPHYRRGVRVGNYAEEILASDYAGRPGCVLDSAAARFEGTATSAAALGAAGKSGAELAAAARREDLRLKYGKYGAGQALPQGQEAFFATTSQLAFEHAGDTAGAPPLKVQDCLWAGTKFVDRRVPRSVGAHSLEGQRRQQLEAEAAASPYQTVEKESQQRAATDPRRSEARAQQCRPHAQGGQEAQVGRKASGEFVNSFNRDCLRIGLRKP